MFRLLVLQAWTRSSSFRATRTRRSTRRPSISSSTTSAWRRKTPVWLRRWTKPSSSTFSLSKRPPWRASSSNRPPDTGLGSVRHVQDLPVPVSVLQASAQPHTQINLDRPRGSALLADELDHCFTHTRLQELGFYFILFCLNLSSATLQIGSGQNKTKKNQPNNISSFSYLSGRTFPTGSHEPGVFLPLHLSWVLIPCVQAFFWKTTVS